MIDETDLDIIEELKKDGRASFSDIAEKLGLATSTVTGRFQKLEEKEIITGFNPEIDYEKLGFELTAMIDIKAEADKIVETVETLESKTRVISFFEVTGETDMILVSRFLDREDMNQFLKDLQQTEGIKSTETNVILTEPKLEDNIDLKKLMKEKDKDLS
jgi:Transcriptional regulators